ncbi:dipeptide transport ATP-binding protein DppD [Treponema primitia ZAS-2]|uniref:Dipeptide transport ATP-binding protein DppD n=1 Tax=Treponema primitia (strain ATCC BAA-887 / DSM 12427 / ZAS-2) TaxID=545694 RepID=F5YNF3_TREPZ|nr:ABC transporter ATP-binding protein [Treponema primitia]AEF85758.1 dipeptide transport ATP-binding protein DppD [Treponema primitia ZAS-2]
MERKKVLTVDNLKTYFFLSSGTAKAVDGVSFSIEEGRTLGIVGESGCGKSITAFSLIKLLPPTGRIVEGRILFEGADVLQFDKKRMRDFRGKDISFIFQNPMTSLDPVFTVGFQMIETICAHQDKTRKEAYAMAVKALADVGIPNPKSRMSAYPYELSGGMCQRVIIAMALCNRAKLVIADEPTTALDVTVQDQVLELLRRLQEEAGTSIILITHNIGVVWEMCHDVMVMYAGKTVEHAETGELYKNPLHPYTWGLLDSIPRLSADQNEKLNTIEGTPPDLRLTGQYCNFHNRCPYAIPRCTQEVPELQEIEDGHWVACHRQLPQQQLKESDMERLKKKERVNG